MEHLILLLIVILFVCFSNALAVNTGHARIEDTPVGTSSKVGSARSYGYRLPTGQSMQNRGGGASIVGENVYVIRRRRMRAGRNMQMTGMVSKSMSKRSKKKNKKKKKSNGGYAKIVKVIKILRRITREPTLAPTLPPSPQPTSLPVADERVPTLPPRPTTSPVAMPTPAPTITREPSISQPPTLRPTSSSAPTAPASAMPSIGVFFVMVEDFYISFQVPGLTVQPTTEQFNNLAQASEIFFENAFNAFYSTDPTVDFEGLTMVVDMVRFDEGIPVERFNVFVNFNATASFGIGSTVTPTPEELFQVMFGTITDDGVSYILNTVRPIDPFGSANEVVIRQISTLAPGT